VWLLLRRPLPTGESGPEEDRELKYYLSCAPPETPLAALVRVSGFRWPIEACFAEGNEEVGLDHCETRFWRGWYHHMTLVILAHHFLVRMQQRLHQRGGAAATQPQQHTVPPLQLSAPPVCLDRPASWALLTPTPLLRLSLAEVRVLLRAVLPLPPINVAAALALVLYHQQRKAVAYRSHRKRRLG
jgi:hypothetical protein